MRPLFIAVEASKSTAIKMLTKQLKAAMQDADYNVIVTELPKIAGNSPASKALSGAAARIDHVQEHIKPMLKQGNVVIAVRWMLPSIVEHLKLDYRWFDNINKHCMQPDISLFIDDPEQPPAFKSFSSVLSNCVVVPKDNALEYAKWSLGLRSELDE